MERLGLEWHHVSDWLTEEFGDGRAPSEEATQRAVWVLHLWVIADRYPHTPLPMPPLDHAPDPVAEASNPHPQHGASEQAHSSPRHRRGVPRDEAERRIEAYWQELSTADRDAATRDSIADATGVSQGLTSAILKKLGIETSGKKKKEPVVRVVPRSEAFLANVPAAGEGVSDEDMVTVYEAVQNVGFENLVQIAKLMKEENAEKSEQRRRAEARSGRRHDDGETSS